MNALRIEHGVRTALGVDDRFLLGGLVDAGSILAGSAFTVALAALTPSYGEWREAVEAFASRNSHLVGHRFTNDDEIRSFTQDFIQTLQHVGVLEPS
ncbi:hypothetical protein ACLBWT_18450 [Paenibacillus sp. D51F]